MKPMAFLAYNLRNAPDLSLIKYQALEDNTVDGLINRHNDFQRQWNRITILAKVRMSLIIQYIKAAKSGSKMKFYHPLSNYSKLRHSRIILYLKR